MPECLNLNSIRLHLFKLVYFLSLEWENLCKGYTKAKAVVEKEGIPGFYIKSLAELDDFVQSVSRQNIGF